MTTSLSLEPSTTNKTSFLCPIATKTVHWPTKRQCPPPRHFSSAQECNYQMWLNYVSMQPLWWDLPRSSPVLRTNTVACFALAPLQVAIILVSTVVVYNRHNFPVKPSVALRPLRRPHRWVMLKAAMSAAVTHSVWIPYYYPWLHSPLARPHPVGISWRL